MPAARAIFGDDLVDPPVVALAPEEPPDLWTGLGVIGGDA